MATSRAREILRNTIELRGAVRPEPGLDPVLDAVITALVSAEEEGRPTRGWWCPKCSLTTFNCPEIVGQAPRHYEIQSTGCTQVQSALIERAGGGA